MSADIRAALAKPVGEVGEIADHILAELQGFHPRHRIFGELTVGRLTRAATLLQQQEARIADLRLALRECGRAVGSLIQENCSDSFLFQVPGEIRLAVAKATPPAPESGEVGELVAWLRELGAKRSGTFSVTTFCANLTRAATLLEQLSAPAPAPVPVPPDYIDPEHQGDDLKLLETFYAACNAEGGTADEIHLRGIRAVLAAGPATPPAPEPGEVGELVAVSERIVAIAKLQQLLAVLLDFMCLPGHGVAEDDWRQACLLSGRYCEPFLSKNPTTLLTPEPGEVGELVEILTQEAAILEAHCNKIANGECRTLACLRRGGYIRGTESPDSSVATCPELEKAVAKRRAATLLQQLSAPALVVVPVAVGDALIKAECALSDVAEGEETNAAPNTFEWAEQRCAETLAVIRPVMKRHKIRTSEWPPVPQVGEGEG
jgi:hypothetical protein